MLKYLIILPVLIFGFTYDGVIYDGPVSKIMQPSGKEKVFIEQILSSGAIIVLSDDSEWVVYPEDRVFTSMWLSPALITISVSEKCEGIYSFSMRNNWTKKIVRVHFIKNNTSL